MHIKITTKHSRFLNQVFRISKNYFKCTTTAIKRTGDYSQQGNCLQTLSILYPLLQIECLGFGLLVCKMKQQDPKAIRIADPHHFRSNPLSRKKNQSFCKESFILDCYLYNEFLVQDLNLHSSVRIINSLAVSEITH